MSAPREDLLELLRRARRSANDMRKVLLTLYSVALTLPVAVVLVAAGRTWLQHDGFGAQLKAVFLRPVQAGGGFFKEAVAAGEWGLLAAVVFGIWLAAMLVGSFFGLAVTRMAAVELTCDRRADTKEALRFARRHWHWGFLTPAALVGGALLLAGLGVGLFRLARLTDWLVPVAAAFAFVLLLGAVVLLVGLVAGGILAWPALATEWSDAFDATTRVYGYSFAHAYRLAAYRAAAALALLGAVISRGLRALLVLVAFFVVMRVGLGPERTQALLDSALREPVAGLPLPRTVAAWTLVACVATFLTILVARILVFRLVLNQAVYLLLRSRIDKVPLDNIDGYRPDDSDFDPTAQGFTLVEVEEELRAE